MERIGMILAFLFLTVTGHTFELRDLFRENYNQALDFAIASKVQTVAYYDFINGRSAVGGQTPIFYFDNKHIVSGDIGFVAPQDGSRATLAPGVSINVNTILDLYFSDAAELAKSFNESTEKFWHKLFFGPAYSYMVTQDDNKKQHIAWVKLGFTF